MGPLHQLPPCRRGMAWAWIETVIGCETEEAYLTGPRSRRELPWPEPRRPATSLTTMKPSLFAGATLTVLFLAGCSSQPSATVDAAHCYPDTDKSEDITKPTLFVRLTLSSDDRVVPRVEVVLYDSAGHRIDDREVGGGPVFEGEPNVTVIPLNTNSRITVATESCTASVIGYGVPSPGSIG